MRRRFFASPSVLAILIAVVSLTAGPAAEQTGTQPRTPWGDPDLLGMLD